jgi:hypothetical protein
VKAAALGNTALKIGSECSCIIYTFRFLADFRLVLPSLATFSRDP